MLNEARLPGILTDSGASSADAYASAARHSARVRRLKIVLPLVAGVIALIFVAVSFVRAFLPEELELETATIEDGKIVAYRARVSLSFKYDG